MNYIAHLNAALVDIYEDGRLHPGHTSLYMALFFYWNLHHFPKEFYANREELMKMAKIGSRSTYHRLLKELVLWGYIVYQPTRNPKELSTVSLSQIQDKSGTLMGRTRTIFETYCPNTVPLTLYSKQIKHNKHLKSESPKSQLEVLDFFKQKKYPLEEAFKFYAHYQARGWKLGGNTLMEDWKAAADSWVIRSRDYQIKSGSVNHSAIQPDHLLIAKVKNYAEPL